MVLYDFLIKILLGEGIGFFGYDVVDGRVIGN